MNLPNRSIRPVVHLCVAPRPLQVLRYIRSPSVCLFPLKRSLPEARIFPRCHRPVAASAWSAPLVLSPSPSSFASLPSLQCLESLVHVSQAFVFFFFPFRIHILFFEILLYCGKHSRLEIHVPHSVADRGCEVMQISRTYSLFNPFSGSASPFRCQKCLKMFLFYPYT